MTISRRPVAPADEPFLYDVYASTRAPELALVDWSDEEKDVFVRQQFQAQARHYREHYPNATHDVIVVDDVPVGRLYVDRWPAEIRVVDIALLPRYRRRGLGSRLMRDVQAEGAASGRCVTIHVERFNPAWRLYRRLGFTPVDEAGPVYLLMKWTPPHLSGTTERYVTVAMSPARETMDAGRADAFELADTLQG
jgi:ribosomal protein S18 acetylase RimI-like enzyme